MTSESKPTYLSRRELAKRWGKHPRTIKRWGEDPRLGLPPEIDINGRKYRDSAKLEAWEHSLVARAIARKQSRDDAERAAS
jgi:hypothetical protein